MKGVTVGRWSDTGDDMTLPVPGDGGLHWLLGGTTGSGKSSAMHTVIAALTCGLGPDVALVVADPHYGLEDWAPRVSCYAGGVETGGQVLHLAERELRGRLLRRRRSGRRSWDRTLGPHIVILFDEWQAVSSTDRSANLTLMRIAAESRKIGMGLVVATQSPKAKVIAMEARENLGIRVCFRTTEPEQTDCVLGSQRWPCHLPHAAGGIGVSDRGVCWVGAPDGMRRGRFDALGLSEDDVGEAAARIAAAHAADTPALAGWPAEITATREEV